MYKVIKQHSTTIVQNDSTEGETIEQKIERIVNNGEPIKDGSPTYYTEREDGVLPEYNPRTDRFEVAIDAMDKVAKTQLAKRKKVLDEKKQAENPPQNGQSPANSDTSEVTK
jgi:hypothetical protein